MKTKSFLIAAASVVTLSLVTSGLVSAKKPVRSVQHPVTATFADDPNDGVQSDGYGPYQNSETYISTQNIYGIVNINTGDRTACWIYPTAFRAQARRRLIQEKVTT